MLTQARLMPEFDGRVIAFGNKKLPDTHGILNLSSAKNCPSAALGMCAVEKVCYAKKCERIRTTYLNKNLAVEEWLNRASEDDIFDMISAYVEAQPQEVTHLRLNEAGDFRDQAQVDMFSRIADRLKEKYGIVTYGWSARKDLDFSNAHILLNGSSEEVKGAIRVFKAVTRAEFDALPKDAVICGGSRGLSCRTCHLCHNDKFRGTIYCLNH